MGNRKWKFKKVFRNLYGRQIWIVTNRKGRRGYFKFPVSRKRKEHRILIANEFIAASLARSVGLPVAQVKEIKVKGPKGLKRKGILSLKAKAKKVIPWRKAREELHLRPDQYVEKANQLAQVMVFDAWILNPDRTNRNLVLYRKKSRDRYKWYLIDHGIALFGKASQWSLRKAKKTYSCKRSSRMSLLSRTKRGLRIPKGLKRFSSENWQSTESMIVKIQSLPKAVITKAFTKVPHGYLKKSEKRFMKSVLRCRQKRLRQIVEKATKRFRSLET